jgi:hypothetical protein
MMMPRFSDAKPLIAILLEEGFPTTKTSSVSPDEVGNDLREAGFDAHPITVSEAASVLLRAEDPPAAFVIVQGNAFPMELEGVLPQYIARGGFVLSNGIPLVHLIERSEDGWRNTGHNERLAKSLGIGEFGGSRLRTIKPDALGIHLGLGELPWEGIRLKENLQGLIPGTVGEGWTAEPILSDESGLAFAALLTRESGGAFAWTGTTDIGSSLAASSRVHREIIRRVLAEHLARTGRLDSEVAERILEPPGPEVAREFLKSIYTPTFIEKRSESLYPSAANKPPRELLVLEVNDITLDDDLLVSSIQGLFNSRPDAESLLYVIRGDSDHRWLNWLVGEKYVEKASPVPDIASAIRLLGSPEAIVVPEEPPQAINAAMLMAARDQRVLVRSRASATQHGLTVAEDLTGRWETNVAVLVDALFEHRDEINREVVAIYSPTRLHHLRDYLIANRVYTFWVSGPAESSLPGVSAAAEEEWIRQALAREFPVNIPALGYPWAGDGVGIGEHGGVALLSSTGKFLVPSDHMPNLTVFTAFRARHDGPLAPAQPAPDLKPEGVYASLVMSDGDNLCTWIDFFPDYWEKLTPGLPPIAWTVGPSIRDLLPPVHDALAQWHPKGHTLGAAVSGIGYIYIEDYGTAYGEEREAVVREFMSLTDAACARQGIEWIWIMGYGGPGSPLLDFYTDGLPHVPTIMGGYGREASSPEMAMERRGNSIVFHSVTGAHAMEGILRDVDEIIKGTQRPLFLHVFLLNWEVPAERLASLTRELERRGITIVAPEHLDALARGTLDGSP